MNLVDILKDVPVGTKLYCPIYGTVEFLGVDKGGDYPIKVTKTHGDRCLESFTYDGKLYHDEYSDAECILFPSKENRDWGKFHVYLPVGTRVVLTDNLSNDLRIGTYMGNNKAKFGIYVTEWNYIIPVTKFNFETNSFNPKDNYGSTKV